MTASYNFPGNGIARFGFVDNADTETFIPGPAMELDYASGNLLLAQSGGRVGIGTATADYTLDVDGEIRATGAIHGTADNAVNAANAVNATNAVNAENADNADKVDGNHIVVARVFTASGTQYLVNTSYAQIYADGTANSLKIHNPGGSGFQYYYSIDQSSPVWATLSAAGTVTISGISTNAIDIRIMAAGRYVSFSGIGGGNGWISGQAFYQ
jgi:hypothetical protein